MAWLALALLMSACSDEVVAPPVTIAPQPQSRPPPPPVSVFSPPNEVRAEILRWFSAAGYRGFQVEALAEHAKVESGFRPCAAGAAGLRYTYQWGGRRLEQLYDFAGERRCPSLDAQLAFTDSELRTEPNFYCFWQTTTKSAALAALRRGFGRGRC
jgi:hypothetical protein